MAARLSDPSAHPFGAAVGRLVDEFASFPGIGRKTADEIATLYREPDIAVGIENQCVRITRPLIGHRKFLDSACPRIETADV